MYPILHSSSFFFFLAIVFSSLELSTPFRIVKDEAKFRSCSQQFNCGNITNISYPFWGGDRIQDCGRPEYKLECRDSTYTEIEIESTKFTILGIRKMDQTLTVVGTDIMDDGCPDRIPNIRVDDSPFECASNKSKLTYFYDCRDGIIPSKIPPELRCERNSEPFYNGFFQVEPHPRDPSCKSSIPVPILENYTWDLNMTKEVVKKGFDLRYKDVDAGTDCQKCIHSAGQCGYDRTSDEFVCFSCPSSDNNFVGAVDQLFQNCSVPRFCGSQLITFPFYTDEEQKHCGYPGFHLSCNYYNGSNHIPILNLYGDDYIVHEIFYENQSLIVSNAAFSTPNTACFPPIRNVSLPPDFTLASDEINCKVFLLQNCTSSSDLNKYKIGCSAENDTNWVLALPENDEKKVDEASEKCGIESNEVGELPVMEYNSSEINNEEEMREVLSRGFMLHWIASDCTLCNSTGGKCGFDYSFHHFKCFCPDRPHAAKCDRPGHWGKVVVMEATAAAAAGTVILIVSICCLRKKFTSNDRSILFWKKQNQAQRNIEAFLRHYGPLQARRYSYLDVKKMTNSFKEKLGQGGFGSVYKGKLNDGSLVAVKMLDKSKANGDEFINEVAAISRTSHVNVVSLLGFCFEGGKRALIYEFMPNGSLEKFVFDENRTENGNDQLDWETYYRISLGIARGLEYLHRGCNTRILHFDIKPHNILLDEGFVPKISDFGLAKICTRKESLVSMAGPRGTMGYIAPEVFCRNFGGISHKSDVYSYGMMVLEMVGGRQNLNVRADNTSEIYFPHWIYKRLELDEELGLKRISNEGDQVKVRKMIIVSLWCIQTDPSNRPPMSKVIEMLEGSLNSLQVPPKPFLSSPPISPKAEFSSTFESF